MITKSKGHGVRVRVMVLENKCHGVRKKKSNGYVCDCKGWR
jgi:hypothetical protein